MKYYEEAVRKGLERARKAPITYFNHVGITIALLRADIFKAGVKQMIGPCLVAKAIDNGQINCKTRALIVHGTGNTASAVKTGVDELGLGLKVIAVLYRETNQQVKRRLKTQGIEVIAETSRTDGRNGRLEIVQRLCKNSGYILLEQHKTPTILDIQCQTFGTRITEEVKATHFIAGVGTGGTLFGIGQALREKDPNINLIGVEGLGSTLTLWHSYLSVKDQNFNVQKQAIENALEKYRIAGMLTELACYPDHEPNEWFEINIDFPDSIAGTIGIEGLGVGEPTEMIKNHLPMINSCQIVTDGQVQQGLQMLEALGIIAFESAGANLFASIKLAEELKEKNEPGMIVTVVTARAKG